MFSPTRRAKRQSALRMFASEFGESTLYDRGPGEYDPGFVISKLGARANRLLVAGLLDRLEERETSSGGKLWQGQLRDASGLHFFSVGDFASDEVREFISDLEVRHRDGEPILLMMSAKARWFQNDEGSVYTSIRPEEICEINRARYGNWLVETCKSTLRRIDALNTASSSDGSRSEMSTIGVPADLLEGLVMSMNHYQDVDVEVYRLHVMRALDIAEGRNEVQTPKIVEKDATIVETESKSETSDGIRDVITSLISRMDQGDGVDFDTLVTNASARGHDRVIIEEELDNMSDSGLIHEPRFGWFKLS